MLKIEEVATSIMLIIKLLKFVKSTKQVNQHIIYHYNKVYALPQQVQHDLIE